MKYEKNGNVLETNLETGLSTEEVERRRELFVNNTIQVEEKNSKLVIVLMICIMICIDCILAGIICWGIKYMICNPYQNLWEMIAKVLMAIMIIGVYYYETKNEVNEIVYYAKFITIQIQKKKERQKEKILVFRNYKEILIERQEITVGDLLQVKEGMKVPVNGVVIKGEIFITNINSDVVRHKVPAQSDGILKSVEVESRVEEGALVINGSATILYLC